jgi:hypothetical protein
MVGESGIPLYVNTQMFRPDNISGCNLVEPLLEGVEDITRKIEKAYFYVLGLL